MMRITAPAGVPAYPANIYPTDAIVHHGRLEPGTHFLSKPFTRTAFARKVREVLDS